MSKSVGIVQPYLFPYIGYFQLVSAVDTFIFYDDVHFITRGWINRNKILINGSSKYFTVPCRNASQNRLIYEVEHALNKKERSRLLRKIQFSYSNAPNFEQVYPIIQTVINKNTDKISDLAIASVKETMEYLGIQIETKISSEHYANRDLDRADRLIDICRREGATRYINPIGGREIYDKAYFKKQGIELCFLEPRLTEYDQNVDSFVPWLSIIDILMFNSAGKVRKQFLNHYELV